MSVKIEHSFPAPNGGVVLFPEDQVRVSYAVDKANLGCGLLYVWKKMPDGRTLSLFVNFERGLVVADVVEKNGKFGNEFVRATAPTALSASDIRRLQKLKDTDGKEAE